MITKKEDLHNTYIINDHGELRDLFLEKCKELGLVWLSGNDPFGSRIGLSSAKIGVVSGIICTDGAGRMLTDADLKPQTKKVEWVNGLPPVGETFTTNPGFDEELICKYSSKWVVVGEMINVPKKLKGMEVIIDIKANKREFRKPETPEQKLEREELEAAYDLYCDAVDKETLFDSFCNFGPLKDIYLRIVRKTNYKVKGE
ncbi:hypothetical protein NVP1091O_27 [Vibrio phage 1.091.O._10N.286.52.B12]|nr:hypothetical protein NVP1091O_27 [Vibrio phage 1.091.O._10N.286.52.B12]